jgi:HAD superfamily phosphoserine phosphatase-like hydrolase
VKTAFCFDLDGTITTEEILPLLAREVGLYEEISALTDATINGIIPFQKSFMLRCRLLREIPISRVRQIISTVGLHDKIVRFIQNRPDDCFIITGNLDVWVEDLAHTIGGNLFSSAASEENDTLQTIETVINKGDIVVNLKDRYDRIVAVGDGMGDVGMFEKADIRIAYGGVHNPIQTLVELSDYVIFNETALCRTLDTLL